MALADTRGLHAEKRGKVEDQVNRVLDSTDTISAEFFIQVLH